MNILAGLFSFNWTDPRRPDWDYVSDKIAVTLFGKIDIAWYAIMISMAIIISVVLGYFGYAKRLGATSDLLSEGVIIGVLAGIIGGRAWYVIADLVKSWTTDYKSSFTSIGSILDIRSGGLAISGAVLLVGVALFIFCRYRKLKLLYILEIVLPLVMLSQVLGRWGNFFNFEAHGGLIQVEGLEEALKTGRVILSDNILDAQREALWFIPRVIVDRMYIYDEVAGAYGYCHPCFLYEGMANLFGFTLYMILRRFVKKGIYVGDGISFYLVWYGIVRFFIEMMRTDAQTIGNSNIPVVMVYASIMIIAGIVWFIVRRVKKIQLETCYDALYGFDSTLRINPDDTKKKNKKQKTKIETEEAQNAEV